MKYLFFDIECANTKDGICKMCSFGYVVTDTAFNVLEKDDLIINPDDEFDWYFFKKNSRIKLPYPKEKYLEYPNFLGQYKKIENILLNDYKAIFGYNVSGDIKFIKQAYERYGLEPIEVKAYDVIKISKEYGGYTGKLANIPKELLKDEGIDLTSHKSVDDAYKTMIVLKRALSLDFCGIDKLE
ncbi:hypothetical protein [Acholeplasma hippikon]|uniref:Exonuclease n=1 Tax=Acholeplasma hippikon TaxID=264636 RepID=A0A449BJX7_9MOLU|nr:hypothetical protein [Acholeplasma hippikon]VEU82748.1 Uncharacterised protein [Acholeplasma hippikon]